MTRAADVVRNRHRPRTVQSANHSESDLEAEPSIVRDPPIVRRTTVLISVVLVALGIWAVTSAASIPEAIASSVGPICLVLLLWRGDLDDPVSIVLIVLLFNFEALLYAATIRAGIAFAVLLPCTGVAAMSGVKQGKLWVALAGSAWAATVAGSVLWMSVGPAASFLPVQSPATTLAGIMGVSALGLSFLWRSNRRQVQEVQAARAAAERERELEARLRQAAKMEAVGQLAGGVAHDFNNMHTAIRGFAELALTELSVADAAAWMDIQLVIDTSDSAARLTQQLLTFARRTVHEPRVVDPVRVVRETAPMIGRLVGDHIKLDVELHSDAGLVRVDPGQLQQAVMNLAVNARDAMPEGGRLTISFRTCDVDESLALKHPGATPGPHVVIRVADTGVGMDEAVREHIFEPFFTTKDVGKGTGMGLSTVFGIVSMSGGLIEVTSEPGAGSTFAMYFPKVLDSTAEAGVGPGAGEPAGGAETILLVEDDQSVRRFSRRTLEAFGYRVVEATDGVEALALAAEYEGRLDLLVSDINMPRMQGPELAGRLVQVCPGLGVLMISGYAEAASRSGLAEGQVFLEKPYSQAALAGAVREALAQRS